MTLPGLSYQPEHEKKFLPSDAHPLPDLVDGTDLVQFYFPSEQACLKDNILHYQDQSTPLIRLSPEQLETVRRFLAWPKPPRVRLRTARKGKDHKAFLTIKVDERVLSDQHLQTTSPKLIRNLEFEVEMELSVAEKMLERIGSRTHEVIAKTRFEIHHVVANPGQKPFRPFKKPFEIDLFKGPVDFQPLDQRIADNSGLVLIELEQSGSEQVLAELLPVWIGEDVTADGRFTNSKLSRKPLASWSKEKIPPVLRKFLKT